MKALGGILFIAGLIGLLASIAPSLHAFGVEKINHVAVMLISFLAMVISLGLLFPGRGDK